MRQSLAAADGHVETESPGQACVICIHIHIYVCIHRNISYTCLFT